LLELPDEQSEPALRHVLAKELRPDEHQMVLARLARVRPMEFLPTLIESGLQARSINVQQMAVAVLADLVVQGLAPELGWQVEGWLRRRLANPRRGGTWATWEIPSAALALLPSYGTERLVALLTDIEPKMQPDERDSWRSVERAVRDHRAFETGLRAWRDQNQSERVAPDPRDPTAEVSVERVMKRLGYRPTNAESRVYDSLDGFCVPTFVFDVSAAHGPSADKN
jgi:hypothetical protein